MTMPLQFMIGFRYQVWSTQINSISSTRLVRSYARHIVRTAIRMIVNKRFTNHHLRRSSMKDVPCNRNAFITVHVVGLRGWICKMRTIKSLNYQTQITLCISHGQMKNCMLALTRTHKQKRERERKKNGSLGISSVAFDGQTFISLSTEDKEKRCNWPLLNEQFRRPWRKRRKRSCCYCLWLCVRCDHVKMNRYIHDIFNMHNWLSIWTCLIAISLSSLRSAFHFAFVSMSVCVVFFASSIHWLLLLHFVAPPVDFVFGLSAFVQSAYTHTNTNEMRTERRCCAVSQHFCKTHFKVGDSTYYLNFFHGFAFLIVHTYTQIHAETEWNQKKKQQENRATANKPYIFK